MSIKSNLLLDPRTGVVYVSRKKVIEKDLTCLYKDLVNSRYIFVLISMFMYLKLHFTNYWYAENVNMY